MLGVSQASSVGMVLIRSGTDSVLPCVGGKLLYQSRTVVAATLGCSVSRRRGSYSVIDER